MRWNKDTETIPMLSYFDFLRTCKCHILKLTITIFISDLKSEYFRLFSKSKDVAFGNGPHT